MKPHIIFACGVWWCGIDLKLSINGCFTASYGPIVLRDKPDDALRAWLMLKPNYKSWFRTMLASRFITTPMELLK